MRAHPEPHPVRRPPVARRATARVLGTLGVAALLGAVGAAAPRGPAPRAAAPVPIDQRRIVPPAPAPTPPTTAPPAVPVPASVPRPPPPTAPDPPAAVPPPVEATSEPRPEPPPGAVPVPSGAAGLLVGMINDLRAGLGLAPYAVDPELTANAQRWAASMAQAGAMSHQADLAVGLTSAWVRLGENVGNGPDVASIHAALVASPGHHANLVDPSFGSVGVGVVEAGGTLWVAEEFLQR